MIFSTIYSQGDKERVFIITNYLPCERKERKKREREWRCFAPEPEEIQFCNMEERTCSHKSEIHINMSIHIIIHDSQSISRNNTYFQLL